MEDDEKKGPKRKKMALAQGRDKGKVGMAILFGGEYTNILTMVWEFGTITEWTTSWSQINRAVRYFSRLDPAPMRRLRKELGVWSASEDVRKQIDRLRAWHTRPPCWRCGAKSNRQTTRRLQDVSQGMDDGCCCCCCCCCCHTWADCICFSKASPIDIRPISHRIAKFITMPCITRNAKTRGGTCQGGKHAMCVWSQFTWKIVEVQRTSSGDQVQGADTQGTCASRQAAGSHPGCTSRHEAQIARLDQWHVGRRTRRIRRRWVE